MEKGEWRVFCNCVGGEKLYIVGRQKDKNKPLHSGNVEYAMINYSPDKRACEHLADQLNWTGFDGLG